MGISLSRDTPLPLNSLDDLGRPGGESDSRVKLLQSFALPLGYQVVTLFTVVTKFIVCKQFV